MLTRLPSVLVYKNIFPYVPCFDLTPRILRRMILFVKARTFVHTLCIQLNTLKSVVRQLQAFVTTTTLNEFVYEDEHTYLSLNIKNLDHIAIYF